MYLIFHFSFLRTVLLYLRVLTSSGNVAVQKDQVPSVTIQCGILAGAFDIQSRIEIEFDEILFATLRCSACETDKIIHSLSVMNLTSCLHVAYNSVVQLLKGQNWRCR